MSKSKPRSLITFLLDRTGSMASIADDTIGGFNAYLNGLKEEKKAKIDFTLIQFDSMSLDKLYVAKPVSEIPDLTSKTFVPRAATPLIDATYKTIKAVEESVGKTKDVKVIITIQTDGFENASVEYTWEKLNALIKEKTAAGWEFNFLGASIDSYQQTERMGILASHTLSYAGNDKAKTMAMFKSRANAHANYASGAMRSTLFTSFEKMEAGDAFDPDLKGSKSAKPQNSSQAHETKPVDDFKLD